MKKKGTTIGEKGSEEMARRKTSERGGEPYQPRTIGEINAKRVSQAGVRFREDPLTRGTALKYLLPERETDDRRRGGGKAVKDRTKPKRTNSRLAVVPAGAE